MNLVKTEGPELPKDATVGLLLHVSLQKMLLYLSNLYDFYKKVKVRSVKDEAVSWSGVGLCV